MVDLSACYQWALAEIVFQYTPTTILARLNYLKRFVFTMVLSDHSIIHVLAICCAGLTCEPEYFHLLNSRY